MGVFCRNLAKELGFCKKELGTAPKPWFPMETMVLGSKTSIFEGFGADLGVKYTIYIYATSIHFLENDLFLRVRECKIDLKSHFSGTFWGSESVDFP